MKLGGKSKDVDSFVDQLKSEGENVASDSSRISLISGGKQALAKSVANQPNIKAER